MAYKRKTRPTRRPKGAGTIVWRTSEKRWIGSVTLGRDPMGHQVRKTVVGPRGDDSTAARDGIRDRLRLLRERKAGPEALQTVAEYLEAWLPQIDVSDNTRVNYEWAINRYITPAIGRVRLFDLDYAKVETFYDNMPGSDAVKTRVRRVLHAALQRAVPKLISANPATGYRVKKKSRSSKLKRTAAWHPDDVRRFLRAVKSESRYYAMYLTAIATTMGPGELFGLQWKSVDLKNATLSVEHSLQDIRGALKLKEPKNESREREIALPPIVVEALREHEKKQRAEERREKRPTSSYVFTSPEGKPIRRGLFRTREWLPLLKKAKVPSVTMYGGMRHSANVLMIRLGASLLVASKRMGHSSTRMTTDVYGHVFTDEDRGVAETLNAFLGDI